MKLPSPKDIQIYEQDAMFAREYECVTVDHRFYLALDNVRWFSYCVTSNSIADLPESYTAAMICAGIRSGVIPFEVVP